jgi:hypothetical protein
VLGYERREVVIGVFLDDCERVAQCWADAYPTVAVLKPFRRALEREWQVRVINMFLVRRIRCRVNAAAVIRAETHAAEFVPPSRFSVIGSVLELVVSSF